MKIKTIPSRWLEKNGRRLDCGPYMSGAVEIADLLKKHSTVCLHTVTSGYDGGIYNGPQFSRNYVLDPSHGVPFLTTTSMMQADLSRLPLLSAKDACSRRLSYLKVAAGMTLITCSGTVGRTMFAREDMNSVWSNQDILKVVADSTKVLPGYLYAYLITRFGVPFIVTGKYGSVITHLEPKHLSDLLVPRLGAVETRAHELVQKGSELLTQYQADINEATRLYFESAGLEDITASEWNDWGSDVGFAVEHPSMESLRAVNFNPRFGRICERIKKGPWKSLGQLTVPGSLRRGNRFNRVEAHPEFAYCLIGQKQLFWLKPIGRWVARNSIPNDAIVDPGSILVAARGTLGESELYCRAEFVWGRAAGYAYSEDILRVLAKESTIPQGALFAFMRSETAFRMLRSISMGSKLQDHHYKMLPELPVPYPAKDVQREAHRLVVKAHEAREKAVALEDEARALVEDAIEKGGK